MVDQGKDSVAGWTDLTEAVIAEDLPVVVFGDHTRVFKYVDFPFVAGADGTKLLRPRRDILDPGFFYFALLKLDVPNKGYNRHFRYLCDLTVNFPVDKAEQQAIARVLRAVQAAREARQREVSLERERKAALMAHLFTHGTRGEPTKQTPIGEMPASWEIRTLGELGQVMSGGTPSRTEPAYWGGDIPWVKTGEIDYGIITTTEETITQEGLENSSAKVIPAGTLLMAMYGQGITRGRVAILGIDAAINQACAAIFISQEELLTDFAFYFLAFSYESIRNLGHGANQRNMNAMLVRSIPVALPPTLNEQGEIGGVLRACDAKIAALERESALLDELFRALLEELMTGRVAVAGVL